MQEADEADELSDRPQPPVPRSSYPLHLLDQSGEVIVDPKREDIESRLAEGCFFWLDLPRIGHEELVWLRDVFKLHPLAIDDARNFGERPKLDEYDDYAMLVLYGTGAPPPSTLVDEQAEGDELPPHPLAEEAEVAQPPIDDSLLEAVCEVHCVVASRYVLTVHRGTCPSLKAFAKRALARRLEIQTPARIVYRIADTLIDSFFPVLGDLDDRIDELQASVVNRPDNEQLAELLRYRAALIQMRRVVTPQRDVFASLAAGVTDLPAFTDDDVRYLRDVYDHLIHLSDLIDSYRDLISGTTDAYLSVVSNQLNVVMKQLSIIATIFLPLSFLTGFFGQNFSWLVGHINGLGRFLILGIGSEVLAVVILMALFRRRGWLGKGP